MNNADSVTISRADYEYLRVSLAMYRELREMWQNPQLPTHEDFAEFGRVWHMKYAQPCTCEHIAARLLLCDKIVNGGAS